MRAFSTLIGIILLLAFISIITAGMTFISISSLKSNYYVAQSLNTKQSSESCIEEVLRRLRDDINYLGGSIPLKPSINCNATVTGTASQKTITATVTDGTFYHGITADIAVTTIGQAHNFRITAWDED